MENLNLFVTSDRFIFILGTLVAHGSVFWVQYYFLCCCRRYNWFLRCRIQGNILPDEQLINKCFWSCITNQLVVQPILLYFLFPLFAKFGMSVSAPLPSFQTVLKEMIVFLIVNETLIYWCHRMVHHKYLYSYIHKKHHTFKSNVGIASEYAHPIEDALTGFIPTLAGPLLMGSHAYTLWLWIIIRAGESQDAHSGYNFPFSPYGIFRSPERHDYHHSHNMGCYGAFFTTWDWLMGTDKHYLQFKATQANKNT